MNRLIKILHIDPSWKVIYILIHGGALVKTVVSLKTALRLLKKQKFDLILSEPQNIAIIDRETTLDEDTKRRLVHCKMDLKNLWDWVDCPSAG
jgi:hypothetical protein